MKKLIVKMLVLGISMEQIFEFIADFEGKETDEEKREFVRAASMLIN